MRHYPDFQKLYVAQPHLSFVMSIWNAHLCNLFKKGAPNRPLKKGEYVCPLCGEVITDAELLIHAVKHDQQFRDGKIIARIKQDHPEWVESDGACPKCIEYYQQTAGRAQ